MKKTYIFRGLFYITGLLVLALGIILNTKTGLGVSPITSVAYCISIIWNINFGDTTLILYFFFVTAEIILHILQARKPSPSADAADRFGLKWTLIMDVLQIPLGLAFTRFLNIFSLLIPDPGSSAPGSFSESLAGRLLLLIFAIVLTGIGVALTLNMRLIPNPGDGIVQAIADFSGKDTGFTKNCFDAFNICITMCIGLFFAGHLIGIGIGTAAAVIGVGRVVGVFNHLFSGPILRLSGLPHNLQTPEPSRK